MAIGAEQDSRLAWRARFPFSFPKTSGFLATPGAVRMSSIPMERGQPATAPSRIRRSYE